MRGSTPLDQVESAHVETPVPLGGIIPNRCGKWTIRPDDDAPNSPHMLRSVIELRYHLLVLGQRLCGPLAAAAGLPSPGRLPEKVQ
jgi:hypothetical protein